MKVNVPQPRTGQIAALFDLAGGEDTAIGELTAGIDRLKPAQQAKTELAQLEPDELREALRLRSHTLGGECV